MEEVDCDQNIDIRITRLRDGRWRVQEGRDGVMLVTDRVNALDALEAFCDRCRDLHREVSTKERRFWIPRIADFAPLGGSK